MTGACAEEPWSPSHSREGEGKRGGRGRKTEREVRKGEEKGGGKRRKRSREWKVKLGTIIKDRGRKGKRQRRVERKGEGGKNLEREMKERDGGAGRAG